MSGRGGPTVGAKRPRRPFAQPDGGADVSDPEIRPGLQQDLLEGDGGGGGDALRTAGVAGGVTDPFEVERPRLTRLAYRMLGSTGEAEDVVVKTAAVMRRRRGIQTGESMGERYLRRRSRSSLP